MRIHQYINHSRNPHPFSSPTCTDILELCSICSCANGSRKGVYQCQGCPHRHIIATISKTRFDWRDGFKIHATIAFAAWLLHLSCSFYIDRSALTFAVRHLHLTCGLYICHLAFAFTTRPLYLPSDFSNLAVGHHTL